MIYGLPKLSADPVLFLPLWLGTLRDYSGYGNHGTNIGGAWGGRGKFDGFKNGQITIQTSAELQPANISILLSGDFTTAQSTKENLAYTSDNSTRFYIEPDTVRFRTNGILSTLSGYDITGKQSLAVTIEAGAKPQFYIDGVFVGSGNSNLTPLITTSDWLILSAFGLPFAASVSAFAMYPSALTATDIERFHIWSNGLHTPRKQWPGSGLRYPGREVNAITPTPASAWIPLVDAVLTDIQRGIRVAYGGSPNPYAAQTGALTTGRGYVVTGEARASGGLPQIRSGDSSILWTGINSTDWQTVTAESITTNARFDLRLVGVTGWAEFRDIVVTEKPVRYAPHDGDPLYRDNIQTARVSLADETAGQLSNTGYTIRSGSWQVKEDSATGERWIECIAAGRITRRADASAYGTWEFEFYKFDDNNVPLIQFVASETVSYNQGSQTGWTIGANASEKILVLRSIGGASTNKAFTADAYVAFGIRYRLRITRSASDVFTIYIKGGAYAVWTLVDMSGGLGANPFTDSVAPTATYTVHNFTAGDRLYLDTHHEGVAVP